NKQKNKHKALIKKVFIFKNNDNSIFNFLMIFSPNSDRSKIHQQAIYPHLPAIRLDDYNKINPKNAF
ncbi:hypothetical protein P3691_25830, partial [Vibrio parahaemolyticus]|nr:hypothetical protein [Vibrio parahaemolyticus]